MSHPSRGAWIEIEIRSYETIIAPMSHPSRGAWIEIDTEFTPLEMTVSRTPHGVRGLKSVTGSKVMGNFMSHPSRGAWIEIKHPPN